MSIMGKLIDKFSIMRQVTANRQIEKDFKELSKEQKTVKPIFCVGLPLRTAKNTDEIGKMLGDKIHDYHILVYNLNDEDAEITFNAFHEKSITTIKFEELKKLVLKTLQNGKA